MSQFFQGVVAGDLPLSVPTSFVTNSGTAVPVLNVLKLMTVNSTVIFQGSGNTITQDFGLSNIVFGSSLPNLTSGLQNTGIGFGALISTTTALSNSALGYGSLSSVTTSPQNMAIGASTLQSLTVGAGNNSAIGFQALGGLLTGNFNLAIGSQAGTGYLSNESSNIVIGNAGTLGDTHTIRIGSQGNGGNQQNQAFIAGITGASPVNANVPQVVLCDNLGQLTNIASSTNGFVLTSNGTNSPTFKSIPFPSPVYVPPPFTVITGNSSNMSVNNGYTSNNAGLVTLTLPATAAIGSFIYVNGLGAGGWKIAQNAGQLIHLGSAVTTTGVGGSLASTNAFDSITLVCVVSNTTWVSQSGSQGNITVT